MCTAQAAATAVIKPSITKGFLNLTQASIAPRIAAISKPPTWATILRTRSASLLETIRALCLSSTARTKSILRFIKSGLFGQEPGPTVSVGSAPVNADNTQAEVVVFPSPISPKEKRFIPFAT